MRCGIEGVQLDRVAQSSHGCLGVMLGLGHLLPRGAIGGLGSPALAEKVEQVSTPNQRQIAGVRLGGAENIERTGQNGWRDEIEHDVPVLPIVVLLSPRQELAKSGEIALSDLLLQSFAFPAVEVAGELGVGDTGSF